MFLNKLIILQILYILTIEVMTTENYKTLQTGSFYLNSERPLWILKDLKDEKVYVNRPIKENLQYYSDYTNPAKYRNKQYQPQKSRIHRNSKAKSHKRSIYNKNYKGIQLPHNYIPFKQANKLHLITSSGKYKNSKYIKNMPVFDAVPGDETFTKSVPIFVYTGSRGKMLINTMLSKRKYPMQEPVPGQILYPPQALVFKPKALVENLQQQLNVTMIPFYAYEAIDPRGPSQLITTTTAPSTSSVKSVKKYKKAKQYSAFYSPQEVVSQPITDLYNYDIEDTTNYSLTLEKPYGNHRLGNKMSPASTTPLPHKKFEVNYNDGEDKFQITYEDDMPYVATTQFTTTLAPLPYESYTFDNKYYAFPVYTMSKLLEKHEETGTDNENVTVDQQQLETNEQDTDLKEENMSNNLLNKSNEDTWFILNSRYKGPLKTNTSTNKLHSSKYIQTSPI